MAKYRKTATVEAEQWFPGKLSETVKPDSTFFPDSKRSGRCPTCDRLYFDHGWVATLEAGHLVCPGDWILTGIKGEHWPCNPDIFEATYEKVSD